jgi:vancomycin permeability regulator SanA
MQSKSLPMGCGERQPSATLRALALFLGGFTLLNVLGQFWRPGFDLNVWWVDVRFLPQLWAEFLMWAAAISLLSFALRPPRSVWRRAFTTLIAGLLAFLALVNSVQFYHLLAHGQIHTEVPVPLSMVVAAILGTIGLTAARLANCMDRRSLLPIWTRLAQGKAAVSCPHSKRFTRVGLAGGFLVCVAAFPVMQMLFFGKTDYRRPADAIIVPGARVYADGRLSQALADRVRTAANLYQQGLAPKLIFSGGPGEGLVHETDAMRNFVIQLGVKREDILLDKAGLNTQATADNTERLLRGIHGSRALVVSQFYHLPRLKMAYHRAGREVYTVPVREPLLWLHPYNMLREVPAQWVYYLRPLSAAT